MDVVFLVFSVWKCIKRASYPTLGWHTVKYRTGEQEWCARRLQIGIQAILPLRNDKTPLVLQPQKPIAVGSKHLKGAQYYHNIIM